MLTGPGQTRADAVTMEIERKCSPSYTVAYVLLDYKESVIATSGAVAYCSGGISAKATAPGGVTRSLIRRRLGDESFFMGRYTAEVHHAWVALAPKFPGDVFEVAVGAQSPLLVESGALLAMSDGVQIDVKWAGARNIAMHEGATVLSVSGSGLALLSSYGGIEHFQLQQDQEVIIDTGHIVAWSRSCKYRLGMLGGVIGAQLTGEGLAAVLTGPGDVWVQTRAEQDFKDWLMPEREQNTGRGGARQ